MRTSDNKLFCTKILFSSENILPTERSYTYKLKFLTGSIFGFISEALQLAKSVYR